MRLDNVTLIPKALISLSHIVLQPVSYLSSAIRIYGFFFSHLKALCADLAASSERTSLQTNDTILQLWSSMLNAAGNADFVVTRHLLAYRYSYFYDE